MDSDAVEESTHLRDDDHSRVEQAQEEVFQNVDVLMGYDAPNINQEEQENKEP